MATKVGPNVSHNGDVVSMGTEFTKYLPGLATKKLVTARSIQFPGDEFFCVHFVASNAESSSISKTERSMGMHHHPFFQCPVERGSGLCAPFVNFGA